MPNYDWLCKICESVNPARLDVCSVCESPSVLNAYDIERLKRSRGFESNDTIDPYIDSGLSVEMVIKESFHTAWTCRRDLTRALFITALILAFLDGPVDVYSPVLAWPAIVAFVLIAMAMYAMFAITCHRVILLGASSVPKFGVLTWSARETRFLAWLIIFVIFLVALVLVVGTSMAIFGKHSNLMILIGLAAVILLPAYILSRLSILLPATAVDERHGLAWAWRSTRGIGWKMTAITWAVPIAGIIFGMGVKPPNGLVGNFLWQLVGSVFTALEIIMLSLMYKAIVPTKIASD